MATTNVGNFAKSVEKILADYEKDVTESLEAGLDESQDLLVDALKEASPAKTGDYAAHWKPGKSVKGIRIIENDKTVLWNGKQQPLAGILEYSTKHARPHIEKTRRETRPKIMKILKKAIKQGD